MAEESPDGSIFPDLITSEDAAGVLIEWYGAAAVDAATSNAVSALADGRHEDQRFWIAVRRAIEASGDMVAGSAPAFPLPSPAIESTAAGNTGALMGLPSAMDLPSVDELLRLIRQFARIPDRDVRDFAIERVKAIADRRVIPFRGKGS